MKKRILITAAAGALALFLLAQGGYAHPLWGPRPWRTCPGWGWKGTKGDWRPLSKEKAEVVLELREKFLAEILPLRERLLKKRHELRRAWLEQEPQFQRIRSLQREIFEIRAQIAEKEARLRLEMRKALR